MHSVYRRSSSSEGERLVLHYLGPRDEAWLRVLLEECARFAGKKQVELRERLQEPLATVAPRHKLGLAIRLLERLLPELPRRAPSPRELRALVFRAAAGRLGERRAVLASLAKELRLEQAQLEDGLFADLAGQRRLRALPTELTPRRLAQLTNQALALAFFKRAERVRIRAWGSPHVLVRHARALGLICAVTPLAPGATTGGLGLDISGPFSLFRQTEIYGRALASLLPRAAGCDHFELEADCVLDAGRALRTLHLSSHDPIFPDGAPTSPDRRGLARLIRELERLAPARGWELWRDPPPLDALGSLSFPELALSRPSAPEQRWYLELLGFWTPHHVRQQLGQLRAAGLERVLLCVDDARRCSDDELESDPRVLRYSKRLDAAHLLNELERCALSQERLTRPGAEPVAQPLHGESHGHQPT